MAARKLDVYVSQAEMREGYKAQKTACLNVDPDVLKPAPCLSRQGMSTSAMFGGSQRQRPRSAMTGRDMEALYRTFYGPDSLATKSVPGPRAGQLGHAAAASQVQSQANGQDRSRLLTSTASVKMRPAEQSAHARDVDKEIKTRAERETHVKFLSPYLANRYGLAQEGARAPADGVGPTASSSGPTWSPGGTAAGNINNRTSTSNRPGSASFRSTTRRQAQRSGSKFVYSEMGSPGPGKYNPKYDAMDKATHSPNIDAAAPFGAVHMHPSRRPGSDPFNGAPGAQPNVSSDRATKQNKSADDEAGEPVAATAREDIFAGAHHVHARATPSPSGSSAFKATPRVSIVEKSAGHDLSLKYYQDGYDKAIRKSARPSSAFSHQVARPVPGTAMDPSQALGPGFYLHDSLPSTWTGRHLVSGHHKLAHVTDWSRRTCRPGTAPPQRPPPANAQQSGYYGVDGPTHSMFPDEPDYSELVSIAILQQRQQEEWQVIHGRAAQAAKDVRHPHLSTSVQQKVAEDGQIPLAYIDPLQLDRYSSTGFSKRVPGGHFSITTREEAARTIRVMADGKVVPPAAVAVMAAVDLTYDTDYRVQGHVQRSPSAALPPNRNAMSQQWVMSAAMAYV